MTRIQERFTFLEFFAGGGMARLGLGPAWKCLFANDIDPKKAASYSANFDGAPEMVVQDVGRLDPGTIPGTADLAWASFPCQDLSLAGSGRGLQGERSGTFWPFWRIIEAQAAQGRAPKIVVLENVYGTVTSHHGRDFAAIFQALAETGYRAGAVVVDAVRFVPQSRPRLFFLAVTDTMTVPADLVTDGPDSRWHPPSLLTAYFQLPRSVSRKWLWWHLPAPAPRKVTLDDIIETDPQGVPWHTRQETTHLLRMMSPQNRSKVAAASAARRPVVGTLYRRTRRDAKGKSTQRAEVRFDGVAGCLRTPQGGSSRQTVVIVSGRRIRTRLLSPREAARLMGLPDSYILPTEYNAAYHIAGDGVVVPVVRHLSEVMLQRLLSRRSSSVSREVALEHAASRA